MNTPAAACKIGDVIQDSYANPAVVWAVRADGRPTLILQTVGSDRGRIASAPLQIVPVTYTPRVEAAKAFGRDEWVRRGEGAARRRQAAATRVQVQSLIDAEWEARVAAQLAALRRQPRYARMSYNDLQQVAEDFAAEDMALEAEASEP